MGLKTPVIRRGRDGMGWEEKNDMVRDYPGCICIQRNSNSW